MKSYRYLDGSGNEYVITNWPKTTIEYKPVKPLHSSSGIYNGGEYVKKKISEIQFDKIDITLQEIIDNSNNFINERLKGSGTIIVKSDDKEETYILKPASKEIKTIENHLQGII